MQKIYAELICPKCGATRHLTLQQFEAMFCQASTCQKCGMAFAVSGNVRCV